MADLGFICGCEGTNITAGTTAILALLGKWLSARGANLGRIFSLAFFWHRIVER